MTRKQAQEALLEGKAISHPFYPGDKFEISEFKNAIMYTIFGSIEKHKISWKEFWKQHQEEHFRKDWRLCKEIPVKPLGLTWAEARAAAASGQKVRHKSWKLGMWIRVVGKHTSNGVIWNDGDRTSWDGFWNSFRGELYYFGWEIIRVIDKEVVGLTDNPILSNISLASQIEESPQNPNSWKKIALSERLKDATWELAPYWPKTYLNIAREIAQHSKDQDRKVGCVVVKNNSIISFGYNGTPHGFDNNCKDEHGKTKQEVIHAESNAITKCAKGTESIAGASMYTTLACCVECAKLIIQCDIKEFYYSEAWKNPAGIELLSKAGIVTKHIPQT